MWLTRGAVADYVRNATQPVLEHLQRLESDLLSLRQVVEGERQIRQTSAVVGAAIEKWAQTMRAPLPTVPRGRAGGRARAKFAWRFTDGTFMSEANIDELLRQEYERSAAGGRARAAHALRSADGTFLPNEHEHG